MLDQRDLIGAAAAAEVALIRADRASLGYDGRPVVDGLTFTVDAGQRVGVLGPNGAGKTTLLRALWGELRPLSGTLEAPRRVGVVGQSDRSRLDFPVSALDVALMGTLSTLPWWRRPRRAERSRALEALDAVGLADRASASFGRLSGGQRQRVLIARALVQGAQVLLLDEPYTGLDRDSAARLDDLLTRLAEDGCALVVATHDIAQARAWDRVLCLNGRQVAFGAPHDILAGGVPW